LFNKESVISTSEFRVNERIRTSQVRVIGANGENVGVIPVREALEIAHSADLDLVEVAPNSEPPVCRIMDFGKFLYEKTKKEREARKTQTKIEIKEIRLRPKTSSAHRGYKVDDARRWLLAGKKVRTTVRFRGREITYPEIALEDLREIAEELADVSVIEQAPSFEGRTIFMMLAPIVKPEKKSSGKDARPKAKKGKADKKEEAAPKAKKEETGKKEETAPKAKKEEAGKKEETAPKAKKEEAGKKEEPAKKEEATKKEPEKESTDKK
jgi:translation initiation factor IF-3